MKPCAELASHVARRVAVRRLGGVHRHFCTEAKAESSLSLLPDAGTLYEMEMPVAKQLNMRTHLPSSLSKQMGTLGEVVTLVREPIVEVASCMRAVNKTFPTLRLVLWGPFGTGKTVTLNQAVHHAYNNNWAIINLRSAMELTRRVKEIEMSSFVSGRINDPSNAVAFLQNFKQQNQHIWKLLGELLTERDYEWSKSEKTLKDKPITEIIEMGISAPFLASDCVGALFRELRRHATADKLEVLVAIDDANSLWGKTLVKRADRTYAPPSDLTLVVHFRRMIQNDWMNGCVLMVADKKEVADARDELGVSRYTPLELFGEEGFEFIEPFLPIETTNYTESESNAIYNYYVKKNWLATEAARTEEGRKQLMHLSAFNPFYYERLCAFN
uniref:Small ribosomal subunit protein mS29 n=1 Tax=Caenorhabditis japonica TaxID=281687 RepID=A0A8R1HP37_CAEJA